MSERSIRIFVPAFLAVYFLIGFGRWVIFEPEIYPIAAWGMFQRIPKVSRDYDLLIHRLGDEEFSPPISARDPENALGIDLSGHQMLVLNGYARLSQLDCEVYTSQHRFFIDQHIVGPDTRYEIHQIYDRARSDERHRLKIVKFGPFETAADQAPPDPEARFQFAQAAAMNSMKFRCPAAKRGFRLKVRKSAK